MFCILKAILAWIIMAFAGTNLIGLIVRGFFWVPPTVDELCTEEPEGLTDRVREVLSHEIRRTTFGIIVTTAIGVLVAAAYIYALSYFWNVGLAIAGVILMASRLPDLIWQLRTGLTWQPLGMTGMNRAGRKVTRADFPKGAVYVAASLLLWIALPLIWYSLCKWKP